MNKKYTLKMSWILDIVEEELYYLIYTNPDNREGEYDWVTESIFNEAVEDCYEFIMYSGVEVTNSHDWRDEENVSLMVYDWIGVYFG